MPLPSIHEEENREWRALALFTPTSANVFLGVPHPKSSGGEIFSTAQTSFSKHPSCARLCSDAQSPKGTGGRRHGWPCHLSVVLNVPPLGTCHSLHLGFCLPPQAPLIRSRSSRAGSRKGPQWVIVALNCNQHWWGWVTSSELGSVTRPHCRAPGGRHSSAWGQGCHHAEADENSSSLVSLYLLVS